MFFFFNDTATTEIYTLSLHDALPIWFSKHTFSGCDVMMENRFGQNVRNELAAKGHKIDVKGTFSSAMGGGQAVMRDSTTGVNYGASDPRKDGQAVAEVPFE